MDKGTKYAVAVLGTAAGVGLLAGLGTRDTAYNPMMVGVGVATVTAIISALAFKGMLDD